jgi:dipeptidyl aminopeptidase/acylaminoacyl peptidase
MSFLAPGWLGVYETSLDGRFLPALNPSSFTRSGPMKKTISLVAALGFIACATSSPTVQDAPARAPQAAAPATQVRPPPALTYLSQLPQLIDRELLFGNPEIAGGQLSPDAKFIAFIKPNRGVLNIWVKRKDEPFSAAKPLTADTKRPVTAYFWSRDSKYILYAQDKAGDENYRVYAVDPKASPEGDSGVPPSRDLTPYEKVRAFIYAVPKRDPQHILIGLNDRDPSLHDVYRLDLKTGERKLVFRNDQNVALWAADLTGKLRLAWRQTQDGGSEILRVDGTALKQIYNCSFEETCVPLRFHKDGRRVYFITNKGNRDLTALALLDVQTGAEQSVDSDPNGEVDISEAIFSEKTDDLVATVYNGDRVRFYPKNAAFARDYEALKKQLPDGDVLPASSSGDDRWILVSLRSDVEPGTTYLFDRSTKKAQLLYRSRPNLPTQDLAPMKAVRYQARDGVSIPAYLTIPKNVEPKGLPVVMYIHGGPWARDHWGYDPFAQFLANRGYAVLQPNYRASSGYGKRFLNLGNNQWGTGTMQHDVSDGVKWLLLQGVADPGRVAIMGGSYGGYATLAGLAFTPQLYAAGVDIVGPSNLATLISSVPPYWAPLKKIWSKRVGDLENPQDVERMKAQSPLFAAKQIRAPLLVIQGQNDPRVTRTESDQIVVALRDLHQPVSYLVAPDEGHGYQGRENRVAMVAEIDRFLSQHLGGRSQESMPDDIRQRLASLTVDIKSLKAPTAVASKQATGTSDASFSGGSIEPGATTYDHLIEVAGRRVQGTLTRTISQATLDGRAAWKVVDEAKNQMGAAEDALWLDAKTLLPLKRSVHQGMLTVELAIAEGQIKGEMKAGPQQMPISSKVDGSTLFDGANVEVAVASLPLADGYRTSLKTFNVQGAKVQTWALEVQATESVSLGSKNVDARRVKLTTEDGSSATFWIETSPSHRVIKSEAHLATQMGSATVTKAMQSSASPPSSAK